MERTVLSTGRTGVEEAVRGKDSSYGPGPGVKSGKDDGYRWIGSSSPHHMQQEDGAV